MLLVLHISRIESKAPQVNQKHRHVFVPTMRYLILYSTGREVNNAVSRWTMGISEDQELGNMCSHGHSLQLLINSKYTNNI